MTSPLAAAQERLRLKAQQELQSARDLRRDILYAAWCTPEDRAQANADWYAAIRKAASDGVLTPAEIQDAALLSRQRYWQITRRPQTPAPTTVQLPEADL